MTTDLPDVQPPSDILRDASILVTGGTGSFGKRFVKTVLAEYAPRRVVILSS